MNMNFTTRVIPALGEALGIDIPKEWDIRSAWPLLEKARTDGAIIMLKLDGGRTKDHYSVILSGGLLPDDDFIRTDAFSMEGALAFVLANYAMRAWGIDGLSSFAIEFE